MCYFWRVNCLIKIGFHRAGGGGDSKEREINEGTVDREDKVMPLAEKQKFFEPGEAREWSSKWSYSQAWLEATFEERTSKLLRSSTLPSPSTRNSTRIYRSYSSVLRGQPVTRLVDFDATHHFPVWNFRHACFYNDDIRFLFILSATLDENSFFRIDHLSTSILVAR